MGKYLLGHESWWKGKRLTPQHRAKISAGLTGRTQDAEHVRHNREAQVRASTPEVREKIAASKRGKLFPQIALGVAKAHARGVYFKGPTCLELALRSLLTGAGLTFQEQVRFGRYVVDAWVPSHRLVFEADGSFWYHHQDTEREAHRDAYLLVHGALAVVHLTEKDLL